MDAKLASQSKSINTLTRRLHDSTSEANELKQELKESQIKLSTSEERFAVEKRAYRKIQDSVKGKTKEIESLQRKVRETKKSLNLATEMVKEKEKLLEQVKCALFLYMCVLSNNGVGY